MGYSFRKSRNLGASLLSVLAVCAPLWITGCAHVKKTGKASEVVGAAEAKSLSDVLRNEGSAKTSKMVVVQDGEIIVQGVKLKNTKFDIPITINTRVENWINYFCGRGRGFFEKYLERSEFFIPYIVPLLKQNGMPEDLVYLAMIESGFNNLARSRARAVGPWQFISATGKRYGLMVNWWVDERRDIRKSTLAAVEYLRDLYGIFQNWELAAAAYNAGEAKVARAVRRFGSSDFWVISKHRFLRPETREYVPKMIAAAIISKNRPQFGFPESTIKPAPDEAVAGDGEIVKVVKTDKPLADAQSKEDSESELAAATTDEEKDDSAAEIASTSSEEEPRPGPVAAGGVTPATLFVTEAEAAPKPAPSALDTPPLARPIPTPHLSKSGEVRGEELVDFEVQSPADLLKIARAAGLSYHTVKALNPEILRWCTPPNVGVFRLKLPSSAKERFLETYNHEAFPRKVQFMSYKVHRGETLAKIARHFGIKADPMAELNGVSPQAPLRQGMLVYLPMPNDRSRSFTSLEVRDPPERHRVRHRRKASKSFKITVKHREAARSLKASNRRGSEG